MSCELPATVLSDLKIILNNIVTTCDYLKDLKEFNTLDRDIVMRLSLIRTLSSQVAEKL